MPFARKAYLALEEAGADGLGGGGGMFKDVRGRTLSQAIWSGGRTATCGAGLLTMTISSEGAGLEYRGLLEARRTLLPWPWGPDRARWQWFGHDT